MTAPAPSPASASDETRAIASRIIASLTEQGRSLAVAESLTGGAVSAALVAVPGASLVLRGTLVAYDTALKHSLLGVSAELLARVGPVHEQVAEQMAQGVRHLAAVDAHPTDLGLATTGVAGPEPQGDAPVGRVFVAVTDAHGTVVRRQQFDGDRDQIRALAVHAALELLEQRVREFPG